MFDFEKIDPFIFLILAVIGSFVIFSISILRPNQIDTNNTAVASTVVLPCKNLGGCQFDGMLSKDGDTYTLTQDDNSVITFTTFLSISKNSPK